jgi:hypothetical protein
MKADDLISGPQTLTIQAVELRHEFNDGSSKPVITFNGDKQLVCNKTNWNIVIELYGTNTDAWLGKPLTLMRTMVDFQGKRTPAIRINPIVVPNGAPSSTLSSNGHSAPQPAEDPRKASATALKLWVAKARRQGAAEPSAEELSTKADELAALCYGAHVADPIVDKFLTAPNSAEMLQGMWDAMDTLISRLNGDINF